MTVNNPKYSTPITIGVVIREIACANAIQARSTGPSNPGATRPARSKTPPSDPSTVAVRCAPRQYATPARTANAVPTVTELPALAALLRTFVDAKARGAGI